MSGMAWALVAGVGFGLFQTVNRLAVRGMTAYVSTFLQLVVSTLVLALIAALTEDVRLLQAAPGPALLSFAAAAFIHFFVGWTLLNVSQKRIGAARTSPLISTVPLWATVVAAVALREIPGVVTAIGVVLTVVGVYIVSAEGPATEDAAGGVPTTNPGPDAAASAMDWRGSLYGLGTALCWAISPVFIRWGLRALPSPLLGLTVGLAVCAVAYGIGMLFQRVERGGRIGMDVLLFKAIAGTLVGLSQWARWVALELAPVGVVLALTQVSVPVVIFLAPLVAGRHSEHVTLRIWVGAVVVVAGSLLLILTR